MAAPAPLPLPLPLRGPAVPAPAPARRAVAASTAALALLLAGCSGGSDDGAAERPSASATTSTDAATEPTAAPSAEPSADPSAEPPAEAPAEPPALPPGSAVGEVVEGYPADLLPPLPDAAVRLTSAVPAGDRLQVSLVATSPTPADAVVAFYRDRLVPAGFAESPGPAGATGATFSRGGGAEVVTVAVVSADGQQQYTVGGTIAAG